MAVDMKTLTIGDTTYEIVDAQARDGLASKAESTHSHKASDVSFTDGETFQQKYDSGDLTGPQGAKGDKGDTGATGETGPQGEKGEPGNGFTACAGTYDSTNNRYTVEFPDIMESIPEGYAFILLPDTQNTAADVDIYAKFRNESGSLRTSITEIRFRNSAANTLNTSVIPSGAIRKNAPLLLIKSATYWIVDSIHEHLFDRGITTSGDGAAYTATVDGIDSLTAGISFIMVPHAASTSQTATLNVNSLGAKQLRRPLSSNNTTTVANSVTNWLYAGKPVRVMYNGTFWVVMDMPRPHGTDIYGNIAASIISAGTFAGEVIANSGGQTPGTSLLRNSKLVSAETNPTVNGEICWTYE